MDALNKMLQAGTNTLASIGLTVEAILPHLAISSAASLIPAVNPSLLPAGKTTMPVAPFFIPATYSTFGHGSAMASSLPSKPAGGMSHLEDDDEPYLPSDNSPPRN